MSGISGMSGAEHPREPAPPEIELSAATRELTRNIVAALRTPALAVDSSDAPVQDTLFDSVSSGGSSAGGSARGEEGDEFDFATFRAWSQRKSVAKQVNRVLALHLIGPCGDRRGGRHVFPLAPRSAAQPLAEA